MSILSSTDSGRSRKLTKNYLFEECHLRLLDYSGRGTDNLICERGIWVIDSNMYKQQQYIKSYNDLFIFTIRINGLACSKILKTIYDADLVMSYWKALINYNEIEMTKAMREIIKLSDLW